MNSARLYVDGVEVHEVTRFVREEPSPEGVMFVTAAPIVVRWPLVFQVYENVLFRSDARIRHIRAKALARERRRSLAPR